MSEQQLFDRTRKIGVSVRRFGVKAEVNFPSDEMLVNYNQRMKIFLVKGRSAPEVEGEEAAAVELFTAIKIDGDDFSTDAAQIAIGFLLRSEVEEPEPIADGYRIPVLICGNIRTVHVLKSPTVAQEGQWDKRCFWMGDRKFGKVPIRYSLPAISDLYDTLFISAEGFPAGAEQLASIPFTVKHAAIRGLFDAIKETDLDGDPNVDFK